jgi:S1-C subfamily serine protease
MERMNLNAETAQPMENRPVVMETTPGVQPAAKKSMPRAVFAALVVLLSGAAGFGGSAAYWSSGLASTTEIVNRDKIVMQEGEAVAEVAQKVGKSVVSIITESTRQTAWGYPVSGQAAGTGIIISKDGYIVTNKHVVSGRGERVSVITSDGTQYEDVEFVGSDPSNDISFLRIIGARDLVPAQLGDSSKVQVGQKVVAIGNALGEYQNTVTTGIISGLSRPVTASDGQNSTESLENLLQTDAAINPGNSGGPLVNLAGEVIGINTAVASDAEGIGFAIPINDIKGMTKTLLARGEVVKPYIGIRYVSLTPDIVKERQLKVSAGALILPSENGEPGIVADSPAAKAGLKEGDIITKVNEVAIDSTHPFASVIAQHSPGDKVTITILRDNKEQRIDLAVGSR